ncbi:glycogen debranching protein [Olivibacter sp. SDN3]|uniref:alpha-L-rhamnosidase-related protein n=1 Tax=Olivibacter sp. SDN3 TaxID=2764720 RepID=UPI00165135D8|nr:trehalase family glycosidase [Olivibacter sp. SDN3]QNL49078.1 glycogen debranching protein [Olivibacter sp. SDN3]
MLVSCGDNYNKEEIYRSEVFSVYPDKVVQEGFEAKALSTEEIVSNYISEAIQKVNPKVRFKFSINGKDNELSSGTTHSVVILPDQSVDTLTVKFGRPHMDETTVPEGVYLAENSKITIKLDLREVLNAFEEEGFYTNFNGTRIYKEDFEKVYIAGSVKPLSWDFDNLVNRPELEMKDENEDGIYEVTLNLNGSRPQAGTNTWKLSTDISSYPKYTSNYPLTDALYNMALEEMTKDIEADSTFRTGKEWSGVWTRDVSYSILLSMAAIQPEVAKKSLMQKVKNERIVQDTGTGGAYPISTDRVVWASAAWEIYKVTGDREWLNDSYRIIKNTVEDDRLNVWDPNTGLMRGESSFLDWREQSYPKWMQPVDIYESLALGTNAVHYQANKILAEMAKITNDVESVSKYSGWADSLKKSINKHLWINEKGYYGQYLYGGINKTLSYRSESLGEALTVLFDIASPEQQESIVANTPVLDFGIPCIYPQTRYISAYHNNAIWPFVQSYWSLAAAKVANEQALVASMAAIYRPAALFLTNKENFVASDGDFAETQVNSDEMLWSLSGNLSLVYKILFGMSFEPDALHFKPHIPKVLRGTRKLENFRYRNAVLDITLSGYGNTVTSATLDGKDLTEAVISGDLTGHHELVIVLSDNQLPEGRMNKVQNQFALNMPTLRYENGKVKWPVMENVKNFRILKNGVTNTLIDDYEVSIPQNEFAQYQVVAIDSNDVESFASAPFTVSSPDMERIVEMEDFAKRSLLKHQGYSGDGFVEISSSVNTSIDLSVDIEESGMYAIDFRYANGSGPINTDNKCAIRTLKSDNATLGAVVFPQRGKGEWSNWGYSNKVVSRLEKGNQTFKLVFDLPVNNNMDGNVNQAVIDHIRFIKIK